MAIHLLSLTKRASCLACSPKGASHAWWPHAWKSGYKLVVSAGFWLKPGYMNWTVYTNTSNTLPSVEIGSKKRGEITSQRMGPALPAPPTSVRKSKFAPAFWEYYWHIFVRVKRWYIFSNSCLLWIITKQFRHMVCGPHLESFSRTHKYWHKTLFKTQDFPSTSISKKILCMVNMII